MKKQGMQNWLRHPVSRMIAFAVFYAITLGFDATGVRSEIRSPDSLTAVFTICGERRRVNCVVDGDTFWFDRQKIRIADIDAPELSPPRCAYERKKGETAKRRLLELLNAGAFSLSSKDRDKDRYGRMLRIVTRSGHSIGTVLVKEGLARPWGGARRPWCD
tara:strand:- start:195 stop:677 length:483 start_codon:yes stop_codon:yes gene_type:complete